MIASLAALLLAAAPSIVVLDVESRVLDDDDRAAVQSRVARGAQDVHEGEVMTTSDLRRLAAVAAEKQALDCDGTSSCLSELADAYGASTVVTTHVSKVGGRYAVEVVLLDASTAKVLRRADGEGTKSELLELSKKLGKQIAVEPSLSPLLVGGGATAGVGVVVAVAAGAGAFLAEGAVRGQNVSGPDKNLGYATRVPLALVSAAAAAAAAVGVVVAVVGAAE